MLIEGIKQSESYQMFIKYSTGLIPPEKSRGKRSKRKKTTDTPQTTIDVFEESDSKHARKQTSSKRVIKKKVTISIDDNIIHEPDVSLELGKSMSINEAASEEAAWQVQDTHKRIEEKNDDKRINLEKTDDEETDEEFMHSEEHIQDDDEETTDEFVHGDEKGNDDEDEEMTNSEDADTRNYDEEITDAAKAYTEKTKKTNDDIKKAKLPPSSSSLSISSCFGNQFLNLSSDTSLIGTLKDTTDVEINSLLDVQIQQEILHIQSPFVRTVSVIPEPSILLPIVRNQEKTRSLPIHIIVVGAENHPPMLEKSMYDSWTSRIRLFIKGKKHVPGQMTHFAASLTLDSAKSSMMHGASCTQRKVSMVPFVLSIPFVLIQGGSISPDSFLPSILLLVVILVTVVIVAVILVVVVVMIVGVVVVAILSACSIPIGLASEFHQDKASSLMLPEQQQHGHQLVARWPPDSWLVLQIGIRTYSGIIASYACMTFIYGSSWKGKMASEAKRYLDKSSEGLGEVLPGEAGK
nr:hypothetical protein [Tanacetum cinerariifolium]